MMKEACSVQSVRSTLAARELSISVNSRALVERLSVQFTPGEFVAVLGRNGSGKTLTLHTLAGLRPAQSGEVLLDGHRIKSLGRRAIARRMGVLTQDIEESFTTSVLESVLIGRHAHLGLLQWESAEDERIAREAMHCVGVSELAGQSSDTLSGGERRRVAIAALLAQRPAIFLLDEPTNHLDPHHQLSVLELFRDRCRAGQTVLATLHDASLAARFADRVLLLFGNGRWLEGPAGEVLTSATLSELYLTPMTEVTAAGHRVFVSS